MKHYFSLLFVVFASIALAQNTAPNYFVSNISTINEIKITTTQLNALAREYGYAANFSGLLVQKVGNHHVLLAKDLTQKWIYAFELSTINSKLYIDANKHISACISETLSLSIFSIKDNEIVGCVKAEHRILGRN